MEPCKDSGRGRTQKGYCVVWVDGVCWNEHRYVYHLTHNNYKFKPGDVVRHSCDNKWCTEFTHLILGTAKDNTRDMLDRGRQASKLSTDQVEDIRTLCEEGNLTYQEIANKFSISKTTVSEISLRKTWNKGI